MREETVLGWYSFDGTVYITQAIANDPVRTASVVNHESTHRLLSNTTPHGFIQETLELCRKQPWTRNDASDVEALRSIIFVTSRFVHEATATYCGLVDYDAHDLAKELSRLPAFYRQGYEVYNRIFSQHRLDALTRYRVARAIGARAMQTSVLNEWFARQLWNPENLRSYLTDRNNCPDDRFVKLAEVLQSLDAQELVESCGQYVRGADNLTLMPPQPPADISMDFTPLPLLRGAQDRGRRIAEVLAQEESGDTTFFSALGHPGRMEIVIRPMPFRSIKLSSEDVTWAASADFVSIDRNVFEQPLDYVSPSGRDYVEARTANLHFYRPNYDVAREYSVSLRETSDFLDRVDPGRRITVGFVGQLALLPHLEESSGGTRAELITSFTALTRGRKTLVHAGGTELGLHMACSLLAELGQPILNHRMQAGKTWSLMLLRSAKTPWPVIVHPILIAEWERIGNIFYEQYPSLERETSSHTFYSNDPDNCVPVFKFLRQYCGWVMSRTEWEALETELARVELSSANVQVDAHLYSSSSYPDAR